jgi:hypothetical protein
MAWCCCEGGCRVFRTKASAVNASIWVVGCPAGSSGLLASIVS